MIEICNNYKRMGVVLKGWEADAENTLASYGTCTDSEQENAEILRKEEAVFRSSSSVVRAIQSILVQLKSNKEFQEDYTFFVYQVGNDEKQKKILGVIVMANTWDWNEEDKENFQDYADYLQVSYLATDPENLYSSLRKDQITRINGIGSQLLKYGEQYAFDREKKVCLKPTPSAQSFYLGHQYHFIGKSEFLGKEKSEKPKSREDFQVLRPLDSSNCSESLGKEKSEKPKSREAFQVLRPLDSSNCSESLGKEKSEKPKSREAFQILRPLDSSNCLRAASSSERK